MTPLALALALLIGGSLGLVGGGGSILTVPVLVHAAGFAPRAAVAASLIVVGLTGAAGSLSHWRHGTLDLRVAASFGGLGALGAWLGGRLGSQLPSGWILIGFALVALAAGAAMLRRSAAALPGPRPRTPWLVAASALGVGLLTGLFGVGGGFLIVPALVMAVGLPMRSAVGTSLAVIAANCAAGLASSASALDPAQLPAIAAFTALSVGGSLLGARAAHRFPALLLRRVFGVLVMGVGLYTGLRSLAVA